jgi:hypothetical protein
MKRIKRFTRRVRGGDRALRIAAGQEKAATLVPLFEETLALRKALLLFENRKLVSATEMQRACPGAFQIFSNNGILSGKGGKLFALSNAGQTLLQKFASPL